jgi:hypothetical protein
MNFKKEGTMKRVLVATLILCFVSTPVMSYELDRENIITLLKSVENNQDINEIITILEQSYGKITDEEILKIYEHTINDAQKDYPPFSPCDLIETWGYMFLWSGNYYWFFWFVIIYYIVC